MKETKHLHSFWLISLLVPPVLLAAYGCGTVQRKTEAPAPLPTPPTVTFSFVGDVLLDHWPISRIYEGLREKNGWEGVYSYPFAKVKPCFEGIVFCNLEGPLTDRGPRRFADKNEKSYFSVDSRFAESLKKGGVNVVSLSNNHIKDCGEEGVLDSIRNVTAAGIAPVGAGANAKEARKPVMLEQNGLKIAFLSYDLVKPKSVWAGGKTPGAAHADAAGVASDVAAARKTADLVVVNFHWGIEYRSDWIAAPPSEDRVKIAHAAIDAGAQIVVGEHSHTVEKIETYKHGLIAYGLGNFVFAAATREGHPVSMILKVRAGTKGVVSCQAVPVLISPRKTRYQPVPLEGKDLEEFAGKLGMISGIKTTVKTNLQQQDSAASTQTPSAFLEKNPE